MLQLPDKPITVIKQFLQDNEVLVYRYMVLSISKAIKHNYEKAELFSFGGQNENIAIVKKNDYERILTDAIGHFTKAEEYEHAALARDVLQKWKVEQILNNDIKE